MGSTGQGPDSGLVAALFSSHNFSNFSENFFKSPRIIALAAILRFEKRPCGFRPLRRAWSTEVARRYYGDSPLEASWLTSANRLLRF
jgi:hypothetical protein